MTFINKIGFFVNALAIVFMAKLALAADNNKPLKEFIIDGSFTHNSDTVSTVINLASRIKNKAVLKQTLTHFNFPLESKIIAQIIYQHQFTNMPPVTMGFGHHVQTHKETYKQSYSLWPDLFGYPVGDKEKGEKEWYPLHSDSWKKHYHEEFAHLKQEKLNTLSIHGEDAVDVIIAEALQHSPHNKLIYIGLGPLHNLAYAIAKQPLIVDKIKLYTMGGATPLGYNWNIAPEITDAVLNSGMETIVITSEIIRDKKLNITRVEFEVMQKAAHKTKLGQALWNELENWYFNGDLLFNDKNLCNPFTLWCFLNAEKVIKTIPIDVHYHCLQNGQLKPEFHNIAYNQPGQEKAIMTIMPVNHSHIHMIDLIENFEEARRDMIYDLCTVFYPGVSQEDFSNIFYNTEATSSIIAEQLNAKVKN